MSRAWWHMTWLVTQRELRERARAKSYRVGLILMVLAVACAVVIPTAVKGHKGTEAIGIAGGDRAAQSQIVETAGRVSGTRVEVVPFGSVPAAQRQLRGGHLSAVLVGTREVLVKRRDARGVGSSSSSISRAVATVAGLQRVLGHLPAGRRLAQAGAGVPIRGLGPPGRSLTTRLTGMGAMIAIYIFIFAYGMRITTGVSDEKSSRVVEVLLATVRPTQLLVGKVLGIGLLALSQGAAMVATFFVLGAAVGASAVHGAAVGVVLVGALWLVLGYALYCTAFAAAGSLITRAADAANVSMPIMIPMIVAYALGFSAIFTTPSAFYDVLGYIPPTAPVAMTVLYATGSASIGDVAISALLTIATTIVLARLAGQVYENAILRTGRRVGWGEALRA